MLSQRDIFNTHPLRGGGQGMRNKIDDAAEPAHYSSARLHSFQNPPSHRLGSKNTRKTYISPYKPNSSASSPASVMRPAQNYKYWRLLDMRGSNNKTFVQRVFSHEIA